MSIQGNESLNIGRFQYKADPKGRVVYPCSTEEKKTLYILIAPAAAIPDRYLICMTPEQFAEYYRKLRVIKQGDDGYRLARIILSSVDTVATDSAGKILINKYLRDYAGITEQVTMLPTENGLEIWASDRFEAAEQAVLTDAAAKNSFNTIMYSEASDAATMEALTKQRDYINLQVELREAQNRLRELNRGNA